MKVINVTISDELFEELSSLMTHHGQRMHLLRGAVKRLVRELREAQLKVEKEDGQGSPTDRTKAQ